MEALNLYNIWMYFSWGQPFLFILVLVFLAAPKADLGALLGREISVRAGEPILVDIPIDGSPIPTVSWKKDNSDLAPSSRVSSFLFSGRPELATLSKVCTKYSFLWPSLTKGYSDASL